MIKIENVVLPSPQQWMAIVRGMRNPMNSWDKSDSYITHIEDSQTLQTADFEFFMGEADHKLAMNLAKSGTDHRKFMRMIMVWVDITAPLYWWKEFDTYKVGTVANSCSTMHTIHKKKLTFDDFSCENLDMASRCSLEDTLYRANECIREFRETGDRGRWDQVIQLLPTSYNQKRTVVLNYEVLANMYKSRKNHKLKEWRDFCEFIDTLPYSELITCGGNPDIWYLCDREACGDKCPNNNCMYTRDITHAVNFHADGDEYVEDLRLTIDL